MTIRRLIIMSMDIRTLSVEGMSCSHCENAIKKSVGALNGVSNVTVDLKEKKVIVEFDPELISIDIIRDTIEDQGYDVK